MPDAWLVRERNNRIHGPYPAAQIRKMILEGPLVESSEICIANGYWLGLHEAKEVERLLGIQVPFVSPGGTPACDFHEEQTDSLEMNQPSSLAQNEALESTTFLAKKGEQVVPVIETQGPTTTELPLQSIEVKSVLPERVHCCRWYWITGMILLILGLGGVCLYYFRITI